MSGGLEVESNCIMTSSYCPKDIENGFGREYAIITMDFVNEDALYPYRQQERLRQYLAAAVRCARSHVVSPVGVWW